MNPMDLLCPFCQAPNRKGPENEDHVKACMRIALSDGSDLTSRERLADQLKPYGGSGGAARSLSSPGQIGQGPGGGGPDPDDDSSGGWFGRWRNW